MFEYLVIDIHRSLVTRPFPFELLGAPLRIQKNLTDHNRWRVILNRLVNDVPQELSDCGTLTVEHLVNDHMALLASERCGWLAIIRQSQRLQSELLVRIRVSFLFQQLSKLT